METAFDQVVRFPRVRRQWAKALPGQRWRSVLRQAVELTEERLAAGETNSHKIAQEVQAELAQSVDIIAIMEMIALILKVVEMVMAWWEQRNPTPTQLVEEVDNA